LAIPVVSESEHEHSKLAELLLKLQEDLKYLAEFTKDPDKVMIDAGIISDEVRNIMKSGDEAKIRRLLLADEAAAAKEEVEEGSNTAK
jgi:hypothetical protein